MTCVATTGGCQIIGLMEMTSVQVVSRMVLPILEEHGHPGPHCWAMHTNVLEVGACGNQWQFPSYRHHCLHEFGRAKPSGHQRHREGLLKLPVLGAPFNHGQYLGRELLGLPTKCQQAFDSFVIRGKGAADGHGTPSDVALGMLHHLLLQFEELRPFTWGCLLLGALPIPLCGAAGGLAGPLLFTLGWPDPRFLHLMLAVSSALIAPTTLGPLLALTSSVTLTPLSTFTPFPTLTPLPTLTLHPIEFLLPIFTPDPWMPTVLTLPFFCLGVSFVEGVIRVWLGRHLGPLTLLSFEWGRLSFGQCLVMAPLALAVQVSNTCKGQLHGTNWLHQDMAGCPGSSCLIQHIAQVGQLVVEWSFLLAKVRQPPRWYGGSTPSGSLPLHHPFCQFGIFLISVEDWVVRVIVVLLLLQSGGCS